MKTRLLTHPAYPCLNSITVALAFVLLVMAGGCNEPRWTTHRADAYSQGQLSAGGGVFVGAVAWTFPTGGQVWSTPVFSKDGTTAYFGSCDNKIYAVDSSNGQKKAEFTTGGCVYGLLIANDIVYATSADGNLYVLDAALNLKWKFGAGPSIRTAPMLYGTRVYFTTDVDLLYSVDINHHNPVWVVRTFGPVSSTPAAWVGGDGMVILGDANNNVTAYDDNDGRVVWRFKTGAGVSAAPAVDTATGRVFIGSFDKKMYSLDANTGAKVWEFNADGYITSAAVVQGGNVYFATDGGSFFGLDRNMNKLWNPAIVESVTGSPIMNLSTGLIFVRGYRSLYLLNPSTKQKAGVFTAGGVISDPSLGPNGLVVFGSWDGRVYAMR